MTLQLEYVRHMTQLYLSKVQVCSRDDPILKRLSWQYPKNHGSLWLIASDRYDISDMWIYIYICRVLPTVPCVSHQCIEDFTKYLNFTSLTASRNCQSHWKHSCCFRCGSCVATLELQRSACHPPRPGTWRMTCRELVPSLGLWYREWSWFILWSFHKNSIRWVRRWANFTIIININNQYQ